MSKKTVTVPLIYNRKFFTLISKSRYVFLNFTTAIVLVPTFNECGIYFCERKKGPCKVLNWFWLICHILSHNNVNYAILYYSNLQLTVYRKAVIKIPCGNACNIYSINYRWTIKQHFLLMSFQWVNLSLSDNLSQR